MSKKADDTKKVEGPPDKKDAKKGAAALLAEEELVSKKKTSISNNLSYHFCFCLQNEEDQALKEKLELCVERLGDRDAKLRQQALDMIKSEVAGATASMTSVPKPLKFMTAMYKKLKETYEKTATNDSFKVSSPITNLY